MRGARPWGATPGRPARRPAGRPARRPARLSLRAGLLAGAVGLTAGALLAAGAVSVVGLRAYLLDRTDDQLRAAAVLVSERAAVLGRAASNDPASLRAVIAPTEFAVEVRQGDDIVRWSGPDDLPTGALTGLAGTPPADGSASRPVTAAGYRLVGVRAGSSVVAVALPMAPVRDTVRRLVLVELAGGGAVLAVLSVLSWLFVRRQLRALEDVTRTAAAIAAGRLDRRVPVADPVAAGRTEVGRLTAAVNGMLGRIEAALTAEQRSQARLRDFLADASHELRTPLTSVRGYVHLLRHDMVGPEEVPDALRRVDEESARMAALVDDLLTLARWDRPGGPAAPVTGDVDLVPVLREALADALAVQPGRPARLDVPGSLPVRGDERALRQVVGNLLANVRVHTPEDAAVTVRAVRDGGVVRVEVADTGPGMPPDLVDRATQRFVRGPRADGTPGGGSGLGLAIVAEIVAGHGGQVRLASSDAGTLVTVDLPATGPAVPAARPAAGPAVGLTEDARGTHDGLTSSS